MVKLFTTEMCSRVYESCMQAHGGMGLTNEMKLYDGWHQARYVRIADGSAEIMRTEHRAIDFEVACRSGFSPTATQSRAKARPTGKSPTENLS